MVAGFSTDKIAWVHDMVRHRAALETRETLPAWAWTHGWFSMKPAPGEVGFDSSGTKCFATTAVSHCVNRLYELSLMQ